MWYMETSTAVAELLRIEKLGGVDPLVPSRLDSPLPEPPWRKPSFRASFTPFFPFLPLPRLVPHKYLYDTQVGNGVKGALYDSGGIVKECYAQHDIINYGVEHF